MNLILSKIHSGAERIASIFCTRGESIYTGQTLLSVEEFEREYIRGGWGFCWVPIWDDELLAPPSHSDAGWRFKVCDPATGKPMPKGIVRRVWLDRLHNVIVVLNCGEIAVHLYHEYESWWAAVLKLHGEFGNRQDFPSIADQPLVRGL